MVEHDARIMAGSRSIGTVIDILLLTTTYAEKAHDNVVSCRIDGVVAQGNARSRSRLSSDGRIGTDADIALQGNDAADVEDDRLLFIAFDGLTERPRARIVEINDVDDFTAASAVT